MSKDGFRNAVPLGFWQALCVLKRHWGDCTRRTLNTFKAEEPTIDVEYYGGPYDSLSRIDRFRITKDASDSIKSSRLVIGEPYWGGRSSQKFEPTDRLDAAYYDTIAPRWEARHASPPPANEDR